MRLLVFPKIVFNIKKPVLDPVCFQQGIYTNGIGIDNAVVIDIGFTPDRTAESPLHEEVVKRNPLCIVVAVKDFVIGEEGPYFIKIYPEGLLPVYNVGRHTLIVEPVIDA
jgi:hypothetical protein